MCRGNISKLVLKNHFDILIVNLEFKWSRYMCQGNISKLVLEF